MSAAPKSVGLKRICTSCGVRFYDMEKRPIICPSCNTEFTGDIKVKARRGRLPADSKKEAPIKDGVMDDNDDIIEEEELEVVSLEDAETDNDDDEDDIMNLDDDLDIPDFDDEDLDDDLDDEALLDDDED